MKKYFLTAAALLLLSPLTASANFAAESCRAVDKSAASRASNAPGQANRSIPIGYEE